MFLNIIKNELATNKTIFKKILNCLPLFVTNCEFISAEFSFIAL